MIAPNLAALHLAINHLPVLGLPFAAGLLLAGLVFDNGEWRRAGLWTAVLAGVSAWFVYFSGGLAADYIGGMAGVSDRDIGRHAAAAEIFAWAASFVGLGAAAALARYRREPSPPRRASAVLLALLAAATALGGWTAHLGGAIRHPESADRATSSSTPSP
jgi:4-amino-4-deoxy-L-arabinose transferase-like glycosyltransferase